MPKPSEYLRPFDGALSGQEAETALTELGFLLEQVRSAIAQPPVELAAIHPSYRDSAENLLGYLCLRRHDIRPLQNRLASLGLSSLGRSEGYTLAALTTLVEVLQRLLHIEGGPTPACPLDLQRSAQLRDRHAETLFGAAPDGREVRIMVTMPAEAADDYRLVRDLLRDGMNCMRINCAHDDGPAWLRMIENLRRAEREVQRPCRVMMDLAGPKLRTGAVGPGAAVKRIRPSRDELGRVLRPARVWLSDGPRPPPGEVDAVLGLPEKWLARLQVGDAITFVDARGSRRRLQVVEVGEAGVCAELQKTAYVVPGLAFKRKGAKKAAGRKARVAGFAPNEQAIGLGEGDLLIVTRDQQPGSPALRDDQGAIISPATIGCTLPEVFDDVRVGEPIWFDDGKIGGVIEALDETTAQVRIVQALGVAKLRGDKGINLPDSALRLSALSASDIDALELAAGHADGVELSFVNSAADVEALLRHLDRLQAGHLGVVLKIETRRGFENLPAMLLAGMRTPSFGVMIARGDLAVEGGFERLAELQEEILCLCEAAHVPVIWATQVLETLAKKGAPSRSEITDAAMGVRAECVMLNKGPHVGKAVHLLDGLLRRMQNHRSKKRDMLRKLQVAQRSLHAVDFEP